MELYNRLIENPLFFKWIYHPTYEIEAYWKQYLEVNPEMSKKILDFKSQFDKHLLYKNSKLSEIEKKQLARKVISQLEQVDQQKSRLVFVKTLMQYAAVAVLFLGVGGSLVYLFMKDKDSNFATESFAIAQDIQEPVLILDNQEQIPLNSDDSELDYSADGEILINKEKVINEEYNVEEPRMNTLVIPYGNRSTINLSDGTKVWLNAGSRLIYPSKFVDKTREVYLVGEAFFDVEKDDKKPFIVKTNSLSVRVLGTQFNISAYPEDNSIQTVLTKGSVEILKADAGLFEKGVFLVPGQMAYWNRESNDTKVFNVDVNHYTLWTEGIFSFSNTDLNRIIKKLERYYNIRFNYADPLYGAIRISGKLDVAQEQQEVFEYLERLTGLTFNKINNFKYVIK